MRATAWAKSSIILGLAVLFAPAQGRCRADAIYQAFDEPFTVVEQKLDKLKSLGYSYVQISPVLKSADNDIWWARYQPLDLTKIESRLGDENQFRHLIGAAHGKGLKVLVDTVLNHLADPSFNGGSLDYPQFSRNDLHDPDHRPCIQNFDDRYQVTQWWLCDLSLGHHLPDLDTSSQRVREVHRKLLTWMLSLGVDGFRFDAVKHIEPEYFPDVLRVIPAGKFFYGEVIGQDLNESHLYTGSMKVTDFHLLRVLLSAFSVNGDLRFLTDPESAGGALAGGQAVVFARNHDTAMHSNFFNFGDYQDALLANAFVLARGIGTPMIYRDDYDRPLTVNALRFHNLMAGKSTFVRTLGEVCAADQGCDPKTLMVLERQGSGVMILNTSSNWINPASARMPGMNPGCYKDLESNFTVDIGFGNDGQKWITHWGTPSRGGLEIGPRSALFLVPCNVVARR